MVLFKLFLLTLVFGDVGSTVCPKGQRVKPSRGRSCDDCPKGQFQPWENRSQRCIMCTRCDTDSSLTIEPCTNVNNAKCQCREGFVASDTDFSTCKCDIGSGLRNRECKPCEDGYFNDRVNEPCKKWTECKPTGVKTNGTKRSDVVCNEGFVSHVTTPTTSNKVVSSFTTLKSHRQREGAQKTTATRTTASPGHSVTSKEQVPQPSNAANYIGVVLVIFVIAGLLALTAATCKLQTGPCTPKRPQNRDSLCRPPVEESGEGGDSLLKPVQLQP